MSNEANMRLYIEILGRSQGLRRELDTTKGEVKRWTSTIRNEINSLKNAAGGLRGQLAAVGISLSTMKVLSDSAKLDKSLTRVKQTASSTTDEMAGLRRELFSMARQTGKPVEELQAGFDNLVQSGQDWKSSLETIKAINVGSAVTNAQSTTLSGGLTVGAQAFNFDLSKPGLALELLDKMTVAGRQGNAELENLSDIFARVGVNAASAGMSFDKTLAFIEGLSLVERQPERLATLADSTLRLFNNLKYMKDAQDATKIRFFDAKGQRRDAFSIISDIKKQYDKLKTEKDRAQFIQAAFGKADLDTQKGMKTFLQGDLLTKVVNFVDEIGRAGGTLNKDLGDATNNMVDQVGMLKADLREAADGFVKPMNETLTGWVKWARDSKANGGLGLTGEDMIKYGIGGAAGTLLLSRYGGKAIGKLAGSLGGVATGAVAGKTMEQLAGITPVFVVNMPGSGFGDKIGDLASGAGIGAAAGSGWFGRMLTKAGAVTKSAFPYLAMGAGSFGGGYAIGTGINQGAGMLSGLVTGGKYSGEGWLGSLIYDLIHEKPEVKNEIKMDISVDQSGRVNTATSDQNTKATVTTSRRGNFVEQQ